MLRHIKKKMNLVCVRMFDLLYFFSQLNFTVFSFHGSCPNVTDNGLRWQHILTLSFFLPLLATRLGRDKRLCGLLPLTKLYMETTFVCICGTFSLSAPPVCRTRDPKTKQNKKTSLKIREKLKGAFCCVKYCKLVVKSNKHNDLVESVVLALLVLD